MEKKYRIVDAEERLPNQPDQYYTSLGLIDFVPKNGNFWDETDSYELYPNWWLEEVEDHEEEIIAMLERMKVNIVHTSIRGHNKLLTLEEVDRFSDDVEDLIDKIKHGKIS